MISKVESEYGPLKKIAVFFVDTTFDSIAFFVCLNGSKDQTNPIEDKRGKPMSSRSNWVSDFMTDSL